MKNRVSNEQEIKLVLTKIIEINGEENYLFKFNYTDDNKIDDYLEYKKYLSCFTIETPYGYKFINCVFLNDEDEDIYKFNLSFIVFGEDKIHLDNDDFIPKNYTEKKYLEDSDFEKEVEPIEREANCEELLLLTLMRESVLPHLKEYDEVLLLEVMRKTMYVHIKNYDDLKNKIYSIYAKQMKSEEDNE